MSPDHGEPDIDSRPVSGTSTGTITISAGRPSKAAVAAAMAELERRQQLSPAPVAFVPTTVGILDEQVKVYVRIRPMPDARPSSACKRSTQGKHLLDPSSKFSARLSPLGTPNRSPTASARSARSATSVKPPSSAVSDRTTAIKAEGSAEVQVLQGPKRSFHYDGVFGPETSQAQVYAECVGPTLSKFVAGINVCVFTYGQTGSGKTWTMLGDQAHESSLGIIPRSLEAAFQYVFANQHRLRCRMSASCLEIYNEQLRDLGRPEGKNVAKLAMWEDKDRGVYVQNLTEVEVRSVSETLQLLQGTLKFSHRGRKRVLV